MAFKQPNAEDVIRYHEEQDGWSDEQIDARLTELGLERPAGYTAGFLRNTFGQGFALGFGDEIEGFVSSVWNGTDYSDERDKIRSSQKDWQDDNPMTALATEIGGGLLTGGVGGLRALGATGLRHGAKTLGKMAGVGAVEGGVSGLGHSSSDTLGGQLTDTAVGAGLGGALGGAMYPFTRIGQGLARRGPSGDAEKAVRRSMINAGVANAGDARAAMRTQAGEQAIIGDIEGTMSQFRPAAQAPGPGNTRMKEFMGRRQSQVSDEMDALATRPPRTFETPMEMSSRLKLERGAQARKDFAPVLATPVQPTPAVLNTLLTKPGAKAAKDAADEYLTLTGKQVDLEDLANQTDLEFWHLMQSHLFGMGKKARGSKVAPGNERKATAIGKVRSAITGEFDKQVPEFKTARTGFRKVTSEMDALELGVEAMRPGSKLMPKDVTNKIAKMDDGEKRGFLKGVISHAQMKFLNSPDTANSARNMLSRPGTRKKIVAAFDGDTDKADAFIGTLGQMGRRGETAADLLYNSNTAEKLGELAQQNAGSLMDTAVDAVQGNMGGVGRKAMTGMGNFMRGQNNAQQNAAITDAFLSSGSDATEMLRRAFSGGEMPPWASPFAAGMFAPSGLGANYGVEETGY